MYVQYLGIYLYHSDFYKVSGSLQFTEMLLALVYFGKWTYICLRNSSITLFSSGLYRSKDANQFN